MDQLAMAARRRRRCKQCGSFMDYISLGEYKCPSCGFVELDDYGKIRSYLDENGTASSAEIELATGVRRSVINEYLRKGRLEITDGSSVFLKCERCGKDIKFGRFCAACAKNMVSKMEEAIPPEEIGEEPIPLAQKKPAHMRFAKRK
ncbi:MAG: hypothetical protein IJ679_04950 [Lachnospiraceae bacterium]|nr:hypothetical protein [Lachnospiraceae bacterium]